MTRLILKSIEVSKSFYQVSTKPSTLGFVPYMSGFGIRGTMRDVLDRITVDISCGSRVALIGRNGSGKSTLLRLFAGILAPTRGEVHVYEAPSTLLWMHAGIRIELSVQHNIETLALMFGVPPRSIHALANEIVEFAELTQLRDTAVKELSMGQTQRIAISVFLFTCGRFLILDESFTYLDGHFAAKCEHKLEQLTGGQTSMIICSHDLAFLQRHCTHALWLDQGKVRKFGPFSEVVDQYRQGLECS